MYKDGKLTISEWQKGQALSPFLGFATMRACEVFDNPGVLKIAKQTESILEYDNLQAMPVKYLKASTGDEFVLVSTIVTSPGNSALYKNGIVVTNFTGNPVVYDMVEYKGYIIVSFDAGLFAYGISTLRITQNWKVLSGLFTGFYMKMLVGQDDILYITNGDKIASISSFVAGSAAADPTATLNTSALDLPDGQYAVTMCELGRLLLIGTQGGTNWSERGNQRVANIYPWDRVSASFEIPVQMQENGIHAMLSVNNTVFVCAGTAGNIYVTDGTSYRKIARLPWSENRNIANSIAYFPNAITTNVNNNLLIGTSLYSGSADQLGVYEIALTEGYPVCLKQIISTNAFTGNINIGLLDTSYQGSTFIGWSEVANFGIDRTRTGSYVGFDSVVETALFRVGTSTDKKTFQHGEFILAKPLTFQQEIRISYRKDTESDYVVIGAYTFSNLGSKKSHLFTPHITDAENLQIKIELSQNEYTSPNPTNWDLELISISLW